MDKRCWSCNTVKPIEQYAKNRSKSSGRSAECKTCVKAYNKRHVAEKSDYYRNRRSAKRTENLAWYLFLECRTRAKRLGVPFDLKPEDIVVPQRCPVFGFEFKIGREFRDFSASVDRIEPLHGYVRGNVRVISYLANRMKSNATADQLSQFARWILEDQHGSERCLDTRQSAATHSNQHARKTAYGTCAWESGNDRIPGNSSPDIASEVIAGPEQH